MIINQIGWGSGGSSSDKLYLYKEGDECTSVTGGWGLVSKSSSYPGSITKNSTNMVVMGNSYYTDCDGGACTFNKINLSEYSTIYAKISNVIINYDVNYKAGFSANAQRMHDSPAWTNSSVNFRTSGTFSLNIQGTSAYIYISAPPSSSSVTITEVWLEK